MAEQTTGNAAGQGGGGRKGGFGKKIGIVIGVLLVLVISAVVVGLVSINSLARKGVEAGGTYALGTKTSLKSADIGLFSGKFALGGLSVANPSGYKSSEFLGLGNAGLDVSLASLLKDTIDVPSFRLSGVRVNLEKSGGKANYNVILDNLKKVTGESKPQTAPKGEGGKKFIVREIDIRDVKIHVDLLGSGGVADKITTLDIPIDEVKLTNVGNAKDGGVDIATLSSVVVHAILSAATAKGGLPAELLNDLQGQLAGLSAQLAKLDGLGETGVQVIGQLGEGVQQISGKLGGELQKVVGSEAAKELTKGVEGVAKGAGKVAEDAAKGAGKAIEDVTKGAGDKLKGLLPGTKKEEPKGDPK